MRTQIEELENVTAEIEFLNQEYGGIQNDYDFKIAEIECEKKKKLKQVQESIDDAKARQDEILGENDWIETPSFYLERKKYLGHKKNDYVVTKNKKMKDAMIRHLESDYPGLIKTKIEKDVALTGFKELLSERTFNVTDEGVIVDDNGLSIPGINAELKAEEIKVKVKRRKMTRADGRRFFK